MFPTRPDQLGHLAPIAATKTLPGTPGVDFAAAGAVMDEVERREAEFVADLRPRGAVARFLVHRAAVCSVRLERLERHDAAATAQRVRRAEVEYEEQRLAEVDHLDSWVRAEPATYTRRLRLSPEGVDRLIDHWGFLRDQIGHEAHPRWRPDDLAQADLLLGRRAGDRPASPFLAASQAYWGEYSPLVEADPEFAPLGQADRKALAASRLLAMIDGQLAALRAERAGVDLDALRLDRAEAAERALFDPGKEAGLARRHELATERMLHRALAEIAALDFDPEGAEARFGHDPDAHAEPTTKPLTDRQRFRSASKARLDLARAFRTAAKSADQGRPRPPLDRGEA